MRVLVIGAGGPVGAAAAAALRVRHEVIEASRTGDVAVDLKDPASIVRLFEQLGKVDAVVACTGSVPFKPLHELSSADFRAGFEDKVMGQINLLQIGSDYVTDGGSFTLTTGILAREPILTGAAASMVNGALESFVMAAAPELPRRQRINAVSPTVLEDAEGYHEYFPGFARVSSESLGQAYVKSVEGVQSGQVYALD